MAKKTIIFNFIRFIIFKITFKLSMSKNWNYNKKIGLEKDKSLGNTNTPIETARSLVKKFVNLNEINKNSTFLEPCVGTGSFYFALVDHLSQKFEIKHILENMLYAYEIDEIALNIFKEEIKKRYPNIDLKKTNIFLGNFLKEKVDKKFNFVITNPPYISSSKINTDPDFSSRESFISYLRNTIDTDIDKKADIYIYFFIKTLNLLKENGKQIFLCSDSWLDSNFGSVLKKYLKKSFNLDIIISHRLHSLFRDDTSAITTIISKSNNNKTDVYQLDLKDFNFDESNITFSLSRDEFLKRIDDEKTKKRNLLILFGDDYIKGEEFLIKNKNNLIKLNKIIDIKTSTTTFNDLKKKNVLIENSDDYYKIFFQIQARVNKPPNYKNNILKNELIYSIKDEDSTDILSLEENNTYLSTIIDRYPLLFYVKNEKTYHVSKYLSLKFIDQKIPVELLPISINNLVTMYMIEVFLKEGTRKTLRVGEMGFGKEIRKSELQDLPILDITKLSHSAKNKILKNQKELENKILYNIETACSDKNYLSIQQTILDDLKIEISLEDLKKQVLKMYFRRMRNIAKISQ